jgi:citronellol/citronellal dehydrogenase
MSLKGKTLFITGASRGIGLAIALRAARDGANVAVAAKTETPHPKLPGTIHSAAQEIEAAGGKALPLVVDVREEETVKKALDADRGAFGGIDIVVNNASAIQLTPVVQTDMRRFDLMHQINARGTFMVSKHAIPHLLKAENPHILMLSPPLDMKEKWFALLHRLRDGEVRHEPGGARAGGRTARQGRGQRALAAHHDRDLAIRNIVGGDALMRMSRTPEILADAAYAIFNKPKTFTGNFLIDDTFLAGEGVTDFDRYRADPTQRLQIDFFVPDDMAPPQGVSLDRVP